MKAYYTFLILLCLLTFIESLYIYIDPREKKCLTDFRIANSSFDVVYYVSGQEEEKNTASIEDEKGNIITKIMNRKNHKFSYLPKTDGEYKFCFENLAQTKVTLSFEFDYGTNDYSMIKVSGSSSAASSPAPCTTICRACSPSGTAARTCPTSLEPIWA